MLYGHGDDGYRQATNIVADFSTNVWYGGEPAGLKAHLFAHWNRINRYPDVLAESLAGRVAAHHRLTDDHVLVNSGTTESIYLITQAFAGQTTTIVTPAFAEYEDACRMHDHRLRFLDWADLENQPHLTSNLVFICNPNNPTGATFAHLESWLTRQPQTLFVVDEAFIEFTTQITSAVPLLSRFDNLVVLRSMTKAYAIPGLRLGYVAGSPTLVARLKTLKQPWTVNAMAIEAGNFIFDHFDKSQLPLSQLLTDKEDFVRALGQLDGFRICNSHTHFFLAELQTGTAAALKQFLLEKYGLLIRDASNFRGLGAGHFRVCTLAPATNVLLLNAMSAWKE